MPIRIYGPMQRALVDRFREQAHAPADTATTGEPYYITLSNGGELTAVLRVDDVLQNHPEGLAINLSELIVSDALSRKEALGRMIPELHDLINSTYSLNTPTCFEYGFAHTPEEAALCETLIADTFKNSGLRLIKPAAPKPAPVFA